MMNPGILRSQIPGLGYTGIPLAITSQYNFDDDLDPLDGFLHRCCHLWLRAFAWVAGDEPALLNIDDEGHDDDAADGDDDDDDNDDDDNDDDDNCFRLSIHFENDWFEGTLSDDDDDNDDNDDDDDYDDDCFRLSTHFENDRYQRDSIRLGVFFLNILKTRLFGTRGFPTLFEL